MMNQLEMRIVQSKSCYKHVLEIRVGGEWVRLCADYATILDGMKDTIEKAFADKMKEVILNPISTSGEVVSIASMPFVTLGSGAVISGDLRGMK